MQRYKQSKDRATADSQLANSQLVFEQQRHLLSPEVRNDLERMLQQLEREQATRRSAPQLWKLARDTSGGAAAFLNARAINERSQRAAARGSRNGGGLSRKVTSGALTGAGARDPTRMRSTRCLRVSLRRLPEVKAVSASAATTSDEAV